MSEVWFRVGMGGGVSRNWGSEHAGARAARTKAATSPAVRRRAPGDELRCAPFAIRRPAEQTRRRAPSPVPSARPGPECTGSIRFRMAPPTAPEAQLQALGANAADTIRGEELLSKLERSAR